MDSIPVEIVSKILMYCHPVLNKRIQNDIINFAFVKYRNINNRFCNICIRYHRFPFHFRC